MSEINIDSHKYPVNPKIPTWDGADGQVGLEAYRNVLEMDLAGRQAQERKRMGPQFWSNLRGEAFKAVSKMKPSELVPEQDEPEDVGVRRLLERLQLRWPEGALRKLPRLYRRFFKEIRFAGDMDQFLMQLTQAKDELEAADDAANISDGILGWAALELAGLTEQEQAHVLGLAGNSMRFSLIRPHLESLYRHGSYQVRMGHAAEADDSSGAESYYMDPEPEWDLAIEDEEHWWYQDADVIPEENAEAEDETIGEPSATEGDDDENQAVMWCEEAEMNYRQARQHLNRLRTDRRFGKGSKNNSSKGKDSGGKGKTMDKRFIRCFSCGRLGHRSADPECPNRHGSDFGKSSSKGKTKGKTKNKGYWSKGKQRPGTAR